LISAKCPPVKPIDTTGAGDIFGASAMSRILKLGKLPEELDLEEMENIAAFSTTAASLSTQKPGGIPSIPTEKEIEDALCADV
jgi:sugar/nucleoside kinase (ribokinase family)